MKRLRYLIPVLLGVALTSSCLKGNDQPVTPNPEGAFSGEFRLISRKPGQTKIDTAKCNISLSLTQATASYSVGGDTSKIHAASKGLYGINGQGIGFADKSVPATLATTNAPIINGKAHLHGTYLFVYNGSVLQMKTIIGDSLAFEYDLKKIN
ncbi:hypothetical protein FPZ42_00525 [Mucilaginibacter achroorhodeus]|uniref:Lipocalin-like domain-containing protein n=1 Tax=Mucilaginibacter achroorhodeus TaxID=2599294 RepID=A0A563U8L9_9SPHI|nr:hypothetical protein [Mucilaginibacter achroorhodeus]TWR27731.1 hypothetical protein FPZ42_00525 [Mucilaginibacter achroorhodeus]